MKGEPTPEQYARAGELVFRMCERIAREKAEVAVLLGAPEDSSDPTSETTALPTAGLETPAMPRTIGHDGVTWLTELEVSAHCSIPVETLRSWRSKRSVLPFSKIGRFVRYDIAEVDSYIKSQQVEVKRPASS